jgi:3',5'-cyclic AMP phosphodiesterase CpdA
MRIVLTSDLHVDHHPEVVALVAERARRLEPDVLVVAGDLSGDPETLERALAVLRPAAPRAVFVQGNHDLWSTPGTPSSRERYDELLPARVRAAGFDALGHAPVEIDGLWFVGVTGWFDYSLRNRELDAVFTAEDYRRGAWGHLRWSDKQRIVWPGDDGQPLDDPEICARQVALLARQLALVEGRPTVVVTHHLPFPQLTTSFGEPLWNFLTGFLGSARLGELIARTRGVRLACAGHTHFRKQLVVEGADGPLAVEVSPVGYPREYRRAGLALEARVVERVTLVVT